MESGTPSAWKPDPTGRHELRYWDGEAWTDNVSDAGAAAVDPIVPSTPAPSAAPEAAAPAATAATPTPAPDPVDGDTPKSGLDLLPTIAIAALVIAALVVVLFLVTA